MLHRDISGYIAKSNSVEKEEYFALTRMGTKDRSMGDSRSTAVG